MYIEYIALLTALPIALFVLYLAYCTLRVARDNGKLASTPLMVRAIAWMILGIGLVLDVLFNIIFGSMMFLEFPSMRRLTFTARCSAHLQEPDWRGDRARWVCFGWLNPFEAGHCR